MVVVVTDDDDSHDDEDSGQNLPAPCSAIANEVKVKEDLLG
jgi:hypothetical protein